MGVTSPIRPKPPRPKTVAERLVWRIWQPIGGPFVFSFDRWRAAEIVRLAASRKLPGLEWVDPLATHVALLATSLFPPPDDAEVCRVVTSLVARLTPITPEVRDRIVSGIGQFRWRSFDLGRALDLRSAERIALDLRTMRDVSQTPEVMKALRLARRRARDAERRRSHGAEPREVRAMRRALASALATVGNISIATSYRWIKSAEKSGVLAMSCVTECEIERLASDLLNKMERRANSHPVTPAALRKRRSRAKMKAEGAAQTAPVAPVRDHVTEAATVPPARPTIASLAADTLTLPRDAVAFDPDRRVILVQFQPVQPVPADLDPAPAFGNILAMAGWPIRNTAFDGETIEIGIGEAA